MLSTLQTTGAHLIAGNESALGADTFTSWNPVVNQPGSTVFHEATAEEVASASSAAAGAAERMEWQSTEKRARFLEILAELMEKNADALLDQAVEETGSTRQRAAGELARVCSVQRQFAGEIRQNTFAEATIDTATASRADVRKTVKAIGPVVVFEASNLPFFLGTAGCDSIAAWSAGCPVIVKGHPSHPGTSELTARLVIEAGNSVGMPHGFFSLVQGRAQETSRLVVAAAGIRAVAFTGSLAGGRAIHALAAERDDIIPVYAEMGSVNPFFVLPEALKARGKDIAAALSAAIVLNNGQLCTKPGLTFVPDDHPATMPFIEAVAEELGGKTVGPLLNNKIQESLCERLKELSAIEGVEALQMPGKTGAAGFYTDWETFVATPALREEVFGPAVLIVSCSPEQMLESVRTLPGQLTGTIFAEPAEKMGIRLADELSRKVGRVVWNAMPTGVEVLPSMHHGGPYPATTHSGYTSVGSAAVQRFQRPVAFQNAPQPSLPPELQDDNPLGIERFVNGRWTKAALDAV